MLAALREGRAVAEVGGLSRKGRRFFYPRPWRASLFSPSPILILIPFWRSARAEWLEWREGWLPRSGASPLRGARRRMGLGVCTMGSGGHVGIHLEQVAFGVGSGGIHASAKDERLGMWEVFLQRSGAFLT